VVDGGQLRDLLAEIAADVRLVKVPVNRAPWTATPFRVEAGEPVTWLCWGALAPVSPLGLVLGPSLVLRVRAEGGRSRRSPRDTGTFTADADGRVEVGSAYPGEMDERGVVTVDRVPYRLMRGALNAILVRWQPGTNVREALAAIAERDASGLCATEAARLADPPAPPQGWDDHPLLPVCDVYSPADGGLAACARGSLVSIIRRPAEASLTPTLRLRWSWRLDKLPSRLPEDTPLTHDYISVALEFDDGRDLTWHWSAGLPPGFAYPCPLDHWRHRETHIVARSGAADLGRWIDEERSVLADHRVAIGGPTPARAVRAWLITVTVFQGLEARGEFGRIELADEESATRVL